MQAPSPQVFGSTHKAHCSVIAPCHTFAGDIIATCMPAATATGTGTCAVIVTATAACNWQIHVLCRRSLQLILVHVLLLPLLHVISRSMYFAGALYSGFPRLIPSR